MPSPVYLDHNATTPTHPAVTREIVRVLTEECGNPSSAHSAGKRAREAIDRAREAVAGALRCRPSELTFVSGGTEANNLALTGVARAHRERGRHLVTSAIEHHAVLEPLAALRDEGFELTIVPVDREGRVDPDELVRALRPDTTLVSVMAANNEVGTVQPTAELGRRLRARGVLFHVDAVQALGKLAVDVGAWQADLVSVSAHKVYGPKGVGALYVRRGVRVLPLVRGGHHEKGRRAGTENVAGIVGFGVACELLARGELGHHEAVRALRDALERRIGELISDVVVHGRAAERVPNTLNVSLRGVEGEAVILALDMEGVAASGGSACTSGALEVSHVLAAMGVDRRDMQCAVRFSLGEATTPADVERAAETVARVVAHLRSLKRG